MPRVFNHQPVLLSAVMEGLNLYPDGIYIDATFGRGGHSRALLERLGEQGRLIAIDKDKEAVAAAKKITDKRFKIFHGSFVEMEKIAQQENIWGKVDGILLDLGISSPQVDDASRGFSFRL